MKIEREDIVSISKIVNKDLDLDIEIKIKNKVLPWMTNKITLSSDALLRINSDFEEILKDDFYSGEEQQRLVEKFIKTPLP